MSNKTFKTFVDKMGGTAASSYIGNEGELFYDPQTTTIRISDGSTPGGIVLGGEGVGSFDQDVNTTDNVTFNRIGITAGEISLPTDVSFIINLDNTSFGPAVFTIDTQGLVSAGAYSGRYFNQVDESSNYIGSFGFSNDTTLIEGVNGLIFGAGSEGGSYASWLLSANGLFQIPGNMTIPSGSGIFDETNDNAGVFISDAVNNASINGLNGVIIRSDTANTGFEIYLDNIGDTTLPGNLIFPDASVQTGASISLSELKSLVANTTTYDDFKTAIANYGGI